MSVFDWCVRLVLLASIAANVILGGINGRIIHRVKDDVRTWDALIARTNGIRDRWQQLFDEVRDGCHQNPEDRT